MLACRHICVFLAALLLSTLLAGGCSLFQDRQGAALLSSTGSGEFPSPCPATIIFNRLSPEQQRVFRTFANPSRTEHSSLETPRAYAILSESQRSVFEAVTDALEKTCLDDQPRLSCLHAIGLVEEVLEIRGENMQLSSDQQFFLLVRLNESASDLLRRSTQFSEGRNTIYHRGFPFSFRQARHKGRRGQEASLHISTSRDGRLANVHVDYRFGVRHLQPANADVRAPGNHQRHVERWVGLTAWWRSPCWTGCAILQKKWLSTAC